MSEPPAEGRVVVDTKATVKRRLAADTVVAAAAALALVSTFLPWASVLFVSVSGIRTADGKVVFVLGLLGLALVAARRGLGPVRIGPRVFASIEGILGLIVTITGVADAADLGNAADVGLYLAVIAGIAWTAAAGRVFLRGRRESRLT
jgi:hypothetical protein